MMSEMSMKQQGLSRYMGIYNSFLNNKNQRNKSVTCISLNCDVDALISEGFCPSRGNYNKSKDRKTIK